MDRQEKRDVGYEANASADGLINTQVVQPLRSFGGTPDQHLAHTPTFKREARVPYLQLPTIPSHVRDGRYIQFSLAHDSMPARQGYRQRTIAAGIAPRSATPT
jgi:hypothetical protein